MISYHPPIDGASWHRHDLSNRLQTLLLLVLMAAFLALLGWLLWGRLGAIWLLLLAAIMVLFSPTVSPRLIMRMYRAERITPTQAPALSRALAELADRAGLERSPDLYYLPSGMVNAFAVGHARQASIALSDGLLRLFGERELLAVLAHEISHIRNRDTLVMGLADGFSRLTVTLSLLGQLLLVMQLPLLLWGDLSINWPAILVLIFAPHFSALAQLGLSRTREFHADLNAAALTGDPQGLALALIKLEEVSASWLERIWLPGRRVPEPSLLRTHPPTEERVRRLLELAAVPARSIVPLQWSSPDADDWLRVRAPAADPRWRISGLWR